MKGFGYLLSALGVLLSSAIAAQVTVSGVVKDNGNHPVAFANVFIKESSYGATTDSLGNFSFTTSLTGAHVLVATFVGYKPYERSITLGTDNITAQIVLKEDISTLEPVVVSAGSFEASDKSKGASLHPIDVVTTAGSNGDIANALRTLPGTQQIGEQEGLFVRGGTNDETKQFMDGSWVKSTNFSSVPGIVQPARVSPFLFKGILFSSGGYSALYGQAMSGALILESVDLPDQSSYIIGASPMVAVAGFQQLSRGGKSSYGINTRYYNTSLYNAIVSQKPDYFHGPAYFTGDANFRIKTSNTGMLKFYTNIGYNNTGLRTPDLDSTTLRSGFQLEGVNVFNILSYREFLNDNWRIDIAASYNYGKDNIYNTLLDSNNEKVILPFSPYDQKNNTLHSQSHVSQGKVVLTRFFDQNQAIRFGGENIYSTDRYRFNDSITILKDNLSAAFAEGDIYIATNIAAKVGVRLEHSTLLNEYQLAPRASLAYRLNDDGQINMAYGIFYQKPENRYIAQNSDLKFSHATHYIINYSKKANNRLFRAEAYYKQYDNLVKTSPAVNDYGDGYARGVELFWRDKRTFKNVDYWVTYTYLDTKRNYLNYPSTLQPTFATPHTASIVLKRFFEQINTSANVSYTVATGRPYYNIHTGNTDEGPSIYDEGTTKAYHGMNLTVSYIRTLFKKWKNKDFTVFAFGLNNVLGTKQVFGYNYSADGTIKAPITLPAPRSFFFGIFMSFGIDRSRNFIEDTL